MAFYSFTASSSAPSGPAGGSLSGTYPNPGLAALALPLFVRAVSGVTPSATANTYGAAVTVNADPGFTGILVCQVNYVTTGLGTETLTVQSVVTYNDNTVNTVNGLTSFTTNATSSASINNMITMIGAADTKNIKSIGFQVKSSIGSSTGSLTVNLVGLNTP